MVSCVFKESSYLLQADSRGMIRRYAAGMGFFLLFKEISHLVDPSPLFLQRRPAEDKHFMHRHCIGNVNTKQCTSGTTVALLQHRRFT